MVDVVAWFVALNAAMKGFLLTLFASTIGRLMFHVREVQAGRRKFWSWQLLYEWPTAIGMGMIADGAAEFLGLTDGQRTAFVASVAFLGPPLIQEIFNIARDVVRTKFGAGR